MPQRRAGEGSASSFVAAQADDGSPLFEVDNRGMDLFVMFVYAKDITADAACRIGDLRLPGLRTEVAFIALKNGEHHGDGYLIDTGRRAIPRRNQYRLPACLHWYSIHCLMARTPSACRPIAVPESSK